MIAIILILVIVAAGLLIAERINSHFEVEPYTREF